MDGNKTTRKLSVNRSGNATRTINYKMNVPKSWLDAMGFDDKLNRVVELEFDGECIIMRKAAVKPE